MSTPSQADSVGPPPASGESTAALLARARDGDDAARNQLAARYLPILRRWAHGRLPAAGRGLADTDDLVQVSLIRALDRMGEFEPRREGSFLAYLRRILLNAVRDELRRAARRPAGEALHDEVPSPERSPLEETIGREVMKRYEAALAELPEEQQEAVILRVEFGFTHPEIAAAVGSPSGNAARMMVARALARLSAAMEVVERTGADP